MAAEALHHVDVVGIAVVIFEVAWGNDFVEDFASFIFPQFDVCLADTCHVEDGHIDIGDSGFDTVKGNDLHEPFPVGNDF